MGQADIATMVCYRQTSTHIWPTMQLQLFDDAFRNSPLRDIAGSPAPKRSAFLRQAFSKNRRQTRIVVNHIFFNRIGSGSVVFECSTPYIYAA
jgi:hypothetical protein